MSLYGVIDLDVANAYLEKFGLEAVEVAPGKALTGFSASHWRKVRYGRMDLENYGTDSLPFLVNAKDGSVRSAYLFAENSTSSGTLRFLSSSLMGLLMSKSGISMSLSEGFPLGENRLEIRGGCTADAGCREGGVSKVLKMGASTREELQANTGEFLKIPVLNAKKDGSLFAYDVTLTGEEYRRPFDPARDEYWVAPGTVQGKLFEAGHFVPTSWSTSKAASAMADNSRSLSIQR